MQSTLTRTATVELASPLEYLAMLLWAEAYWPAKEASYETIRTES